MSAVREREGFDPAAFAHTLFDAQEPVVFRGAGRDWRLYQEARRGIRDALELLDAGLGSPSVPLATLPADGPLSFGYGEGLRAPRNWSTEDISFGGFIERLLDGGTERIYVQGSLDPTRHPQFARTLAVPMVDARSMIGARSFVRRFWIGRGRFAVPYHYDTLHNFACLAAGTKRFSLLPAEALPRLGLGPDDFTPNGAPTSIYDFDDPSSLPPATREVVREARTARLEPGDVLFLPKFWLHRVESSGLSLMMNYWWLDASPTQMAAQGALLAAARALVRHADAPTRRLLRVMFEHQVFRAGADPYEHLPEPHRSRLDQARDVDREATLRSLTAALRDPEGTR